MLRLEKKPSERIVGLGVRTVQHYLKEVVDHLGLKGIGSHSARKLFSISLYENTGSIEAVRQILNHSTIAVSQAYISVKPQLIEEALKAHVKLV